VDPSGLGGRGFDVPRRLVELAVIGSVVALAISRTGRVREGLFISAGIAVVLLLLWLAATLLSTGARRLLRAGWPYVVRQGVANLYRPANQTRSVVLALGFGAFLVSTIYLVQTNLLREFDVGATATRANVLFFDVQDDQRAPIEALMRAQGQAPAQTTPIVTMRIADIKGRPATDILGDSTRRGGRWAVRREYRSTFRSELLGAERVTAGTWTPTTGSPQGPYSVSLEDGVARELGVGVGDLVTWDVQGVKIPSRVTSLREVKWARFEPNFFAVFEPAALASAPKTWVMLSRIPDANAVARLQRAVVAGQPNVSTIDLTLIQRTIGQIVERVALAVRFLAVFCLAMGVPVLFSAMAATRRDRLREGVLLKTLGATRAQIRRILLAEYALLGVLAALTGMVLSFGGAWALTVFVFKGAFVPAWGPALAIAGVMAAMTVGIGLLTGREVFRETPMVALRES
jgi:putative ABC transport system permease protein